MPFISKIVKFPRETRETEETAFPDSENRVLADEKKDAAVPETLTPFPESGEQGEEYASAPAFEERESPSPEAETTFPLNYSAYFPQSVEIQDDRLTLRGIPERDEYRYVMLQLNAQDGTEAYQTQEGRNANGEVSFSLQSVGTQSQDAVNRFQMRMYSNSEEYGSYAGFLELPVEKTESGWRFAASPAYRRNRLFAQDERNDANALAYYLKPSKQIQSDNVAIQEAARQIASSAVDMYDKALLIHDWVSANLYYDKDAFYGRTDSVDNSAVGAWNARRGVCEGYANLTCALLRAAGIPAKTVSGYALGISGGDEFPEGVLQGGGDANHAWNEAFVNGRWIVLDTTWDSGNSYEYGEITESDGCKSHRYFDSSLELLAQDHAVMDSDNYHEIFLYYGNARMETERGWKAFSENNLAPYEKDGHMMAPLGAIMEEMGGVCEWDRKPGYYDRLDCRVNGHYLQLWPTQKRLILDAFVGQEAIELAFDVAPEIVEGYVMTQIDLTLSSVECEVFWDESRGRLVIGYLT
ncbi:MAG: hypothetical protein IJQ81_18105 [Oscillibacter sp.]|nr:hypothetical protein [Oscillibacter sp.]